MATVDDVDQLLEQWHPASGEFLKGNPEPVKKMWSHREDVTLANPYGPPVRGWEQVAEVIDRAASQVRDGELVSVESAAHTKFQLRGGDLNFVFSISETSKK